MINKTEVSTLMDSLILGNCNFMLSKYNEHNDVDLEHYSNKDLLHALETFMTHYVDYEKIELVREEIGRRLDKNGH